MGFDPFLVELEAGGRREGWRCCEASILLRLEASISLRSVGCWFFFSGFLVDCGCGSVGFDLDRLGFSGGGAVRHFG